MTLAVHNAEAWAAIVLAAFVIIFGALLVASLLRLDKPGRGQ